MTPRVVRAEQSQRDLEEILECLDARSAEAADRFVAKFDNVSKIETGIPGVSLDVMFRSLLALGGNLGGLLDPAPSARGSAKRKRVATSQGRPA